MVPPEPQHLRGLGGLTGVCAATGPVPTAIGKDYLDWTTFIDHASSGVGWRVSLLGLASLTVAHDEGLKLNVLGFGFGFDVDDQSLYLPGFGRLS